MSVFSTLAVLTGIYKTLVAQCIVFKHLLRHFHVGFDLEWEVALS